MSTLEARIAEVLGTHTPEVIYYNAEEGHVACHGCDWTGASFSGFYDHQAAMLAPVIAEAQAEAWVRGLSVGIGYKSALDMWGESAPEPVNPYRATS